MSTPTNRTTSQHDELQRLHRRIAELEREQAQRQLETGSIVRVADQHYRVLFEHTPSMYFALLTDGTVLSVNQYGAEYLGYVPEELIGRSILSVFDRADHPAVLSQLATCAKNPSRVFEWEIGKVRKSGSALWVKERAQTVADGTGRLMILVVCEDITAQHQAETQRQQTEESLRELNIALSRAMPGISRLDLQGRYIAVNDYYAAQLGYSPAELVGQPWQPTVHSEDRSRAERAYEQLCLAGHAEFDALAVKKDGTLFHKHVLMVRIADGAGRMIGHHCFMRNITRRKQAEQELHMIKERLQHLITASPAVVYACKPCGDYGATYISDNVIEHLGYAPQEFIEDSSFWATHIHPDDQPRLFAEFPSLFRDGHHEADYRFRHKDGTYRWIHDRQKLVSDETGNPMEIVGSWIDVTDRKRAELALRESEERFLKAFRSSPHPIGITEMESGICLDANDVCLALFGFSREEVIGTSTLDLHIWPHSDDRARFVQQLRVHGAIKNMEMTLQTKQGEPRQFLFSSELIDLKGTPCIVTIGNDITERKRAEEALRESEQRLQRFFNEAPVGLAIMDADRRLISANKAYCMLTGYDVADIIGQTYARYTHPDDLSDNLALTDQFYRGDRSEYSIEKRYIRKSGETIWVSVNATGFALPGHPGPLLLAAIQDITERKKAEEQRERLSQDLHDNLLQSLYAVGMQLEASRLASGLSAKHSKAYVAQAIDQLNHLVHDVRNFIASLKQRAIPRQDLGQALHQLVRSLSFAESSAPQLGIEPSAVASIKPDHADHVLNIAREALSNSLRHAHAGHRWLRLTRTDSAVRMVIADDGLGFTLARDHRHGHGHGLGHMAERAKLIGARLHIASAPGQGTSVMIDLPIAHGDADA